MRSTLVSLRKLEVKAMPSFEMTMTMFWLIAMVFFLVVEAVTVGLVCIWFAAGSLVALLCAMFDAPVWLPQSKRQ